MLVLRQRYPFGTQFGFLAKNLFLAWLPLLSAWAAYQLHHKRLGLFQFLPWLFVVFWIVFLPNGPYLVTDLVHLNPRANVYFWYDLTMLIAFAMTGLLSSLVSLYWMQQLVARRAGSAMSYVFVLVISALSSFGVYLGRYLHWNSWDVISNPVGLLIDIWENVRHPITHLQTYAFSGLFTLFFLAAYVMVSAFTRLPQNDS
jgi:uncharacterized membrane protein